MKTLGSLCSLLLVFLLIASCQKELDFDSFSGPSFGTLSKDSTNCLPSSVNGEYVEDSTLSVDNFIDLQVDVTTPGTYIISSDTINGFSFRDSGNFVATGLNTVRLAGSGRPLVSGITAFIIRYGNSSCVVDVDVQAAGADAVFVFGGAGGTCTGTTLSGVYMEGLATTSSNTATVDVQVTSPGNYSISTVATNGVTFSANGTFTNTSQNTVTLTAQGTPTAAGDFNFALLGNGSSCAFSVTFDPPAAPAVFTLGGSLGNCTGFTLSGTYEAGVALGANTAEIDVTVTTVGPYSISTNTVNGISFSSSGVFTTTGPQVVTLLGTGTPIMDGAFDFTVNAGSNTCSFNVVVDPMNTDVISCNIDGGPTKTFNFGALAELDNASAPAYFGVGGATDASATEQILLTILKDDGSPITAATYDVNAGLGIVDLFCTYTPPGGPTYVAITTGTTQTPAFTITITSFTPGPGARAIGTFSGPMRDNNGAGPGQVIITNGVFDVLLQ